VNLIMPQKTSSGICLSNGRSNTVYNYILYAPKFSPGLFFCGIKTVMSICEGNVYIILGSGKEE
jgi:hypothetical protein